MAVEWTTDLATGVDEIDGQHKEIFSRINKLLEASRQGKGRQAVAGTIDFLEDYVKTHFKAEEQLQKSVAYPEYNAHKAMHTKFLMDVADLKKAFEEKGPTLSMAIEVNQVVVEWLINHIKKVDKKLAEYIRENS